LSRVAAMRPDLNRRQLPGRAGDFANDRQWALSRPARARPICWPDGPPQSSDFRSLRKGQGIFDINTEVSNCVLNLRVP
jgi:hypothetical protein